MVEAFLDEHRIPGTKFSHSWIGPDGTQKHFVEIKEPQKECGSLSRSSKGILNQQVREVLEIQSGGNMEARLEQLVRYDPMKKAAVRTLPIQLRFSPERARLFAAQGRFSHKQLDLLRRVGVKIPSFGELREENERLQFPHEILACDLEVGKKEDQAKFRDRSIKITGVIFSYHRG